MTGTTTQQRDGYELAVARHAAHAIRMGADSHAEAIADGFENVEPRDHFTPLMARAMRTAPVGHVERRRVESRLRVLLTLGREIPRDDHAHGPAANPRRPQR